MSLTYSRRILDTFYRKCNQTLVDLDPLDEKDQNELHQLVTNHFEYTGSTRASQLLDDWNGNLTRWVKVIPKEYKKVLTLKAAQYSRLNKFTENSASF